MEVRSRLWLGGVVSLRRDRRLVRSLLLWRVRASGCVKAVLLFCADRLSQAIPRKPCVSSGKRYAPEESRPPCSSLARPRG